MKNNKGNLQIYAGVGIMVFALAIHMGLNLNGNTKTREVAINDFKRIEAEKETTIDYDQDKRKGR